MEQQPSFDRVVGGTEEQREGFQKKAEEASQKSGEELFGEYLVSPTEDEKKAIQEAVEYVNTVAAHYGSAKAVNPERVFVLKPKATEILKKGSIIGGAADVFEQSISVDRVGSIAILAGHIVHELFHMSSYQAAQIFPEGYSGLYRGGLMMRGRREEGDYFSFAEEAIIATLTRRFFDEVISKDPLCAEEMEQTRAIKDWLRAFVEREVQDENVQKKALSYFEDILILPESDAVYDKLFNSQESDDYKFAFFQGYFEEELESGDVIHERQKEREKFYGVLDEIVRDSKGGIPDREILFDDFARAHFTGNYMPLARKIEGALGKGSFRRIAIELGELREETK